MGCLGIPRKRLHVETSTPSKMGIISSVGGSISHNCLLQWAGGHFLIMHGGGKLYNLALLKKQGYLFESFYSVGSISWGFFCFCFFFNLFCCFGFLWCTVGKTGSSIVIGAQTSDGGQQCWHQGHCRSQLSFLDCLQNNGQRIYWLSFSLSSFVTSELLRSSIQHTTYSTDM